MIRRGAILIVRLLIIIVSAVLTALVYLNQKLGDDE